MRKYERIREFDLLSKEQEAVANYIKVLKDLRTQAIIKKDRSLESHIDEIILDAYEIQGMVNV